MDKLPTKEELNNMTIDEAIAWANKGYALEINGGIVTAIHYEGVDNGR